MSVFYIVKAYVITKTFRSAEHTDTLNSRKKRFIIIITIILCINNNPSKHFNVVSTLSFGWYKVATWETSNKRWNNVVYFNVRIYNVKQRRINVVYFNVDMNNARQRRNNVVIFNVQFHNVGKRRKYVVKMTISKNNKTNRFK